MSTISTTQLDILQQAHASGCVDREIAARAGISLSTVKRYRKELGLPTNSVTNRRGKLGERLTASEANRQGLNVIWRSRDNAPHDLIIGAQRVDAKTSMMKPDGSWRFSLPEQRASFFGSYQYPKNYALDCDVVALVALYPDHRAPDFYLFDSASVPTSVSIRPGGQYEARRNSWGLLQPRQILQA